MKVIILALSGTWTRHNEAASAGTGSHAAIRSRGARYFGPLSQRRWGVTWDFQYQAPLSVAVGRGSRRRQEQASS